MFPGEEEMSEVLDDRSTNRGAIFLARLLPLFGVGGLFRRCAGAKILICERAESFAMKLVRS